MANTIEKAKILQQKLDLQMVQEMTTGWMEVNSSQVQYNGGDEVKIPQLLVTGLGDYKNGYKEGNVTFKFVTRKLTQDRGTSFTLDVRDVDETAGILNIASVMSEFQRTQVVPEVDAYRLSFLASTALENEGYHEEYKPDKDIINHIKNGIKAIRKAGYNGQLVIHANWDTITELEKVKPVVANTVTFTANGVNTTVNQIDNCPILPTADNRMVSKIKINDGTSEFGFTKDPSGKQINFLIVGRDVPVAITKLDTIRIFDPMTNQKANGWLADYRRFHDIWVLDSKKKAIFCSTTASE